MSPRPAKGKGIATGILRYVLVYSLLIAVEVGLAYLGYLFYRTGFLQDWFRYLLIGVDAIFMLGLFWLVSRNTSSD
ncbi:MAG: hypothetical protein J6U30_04255 [Oscillospiraceae bacterium]|nr:hypothetical protein [Oscillospiraceae bacterium]